MKKNSGGAGLLHGVRSKSEEGRGSLRRNSCGRIVRSNNLHGESVYVPNGEIGDKSYQEGHNQIGSPMLRQHRMWMSKNMIHTHFAEFKLAGLTNSQIMVMGPTR